MAAPKGNQFAAKGKRWQRAIEKALEARSSRKDELDALEALAESLLKRCDEGDLQALKELGDRIDGKSAQSMTISGDEDSPLVIKSIERHIVHAKD